MILPTLFEADGGVSIMTNFVFDFADTGEYHGYAVIRQRVRIDAGRHLILSGVIPCCKPGHGVSVNHRDGAVITQIRLNC